MRNLLLSVIALGAVAGAGTLAHAAPATAPSGLRVAAASIQTVQYYEPGWREREEWRRRREFEERRRAEWRREHEEREYRGYPPPRYAQPLPYYGR